VKKFSFPILLLFGVLAVGSAIGQETSSARTVQYHTQDIIPIHSKLNFTTLITLPASEEILDAAVGDKDFWIVDVVHNFVFVHPAKKNIESNLNLITNKGNIYSFTLTDVSGTVTPTDLKVIVQPADQSSIIASTGAIQFVPAEQVAATTQAATQVVAAVKQQAVEAVDAYKASYPSKLVLDYSFKKDRDPFYIAAIYHDDKFTYLKVDPKNQEKFAIYEIKDGKPDLINYDLKDGVYIITHIVDKGYVRVGKKQLDFERKG
jgi:type IV secretion system protein VirB9